MTQTLNLTINGTARAIALDDPRATLLDVLRERIGLTGTKKGCDRGQCGACTVLIDGRRMNACLALALSHDGASITTVEGLAQGCDLHPVQVAFIRHDGFQCGYCTPGQICSAIAMAAELERALPSHVTADLTAAAIAASREEMAERMSGNLCRCAAYPNIRAAIREAQAQGAFGLKA